MKNAYNKDTAFLKGKYNSMEDSLRNARRMNEESVGIGEKFDFTEQNALMLLRSLQDERKDTENYKVELNQAKESLTGKHEEMEKIKEHLNRKMKEIQENKNTGNETELEHKQVWIANKQNSLCDPKKFKLQTHKK